MSREIKFRAWDKENECWLNFGYASIYRKEDGGPDTIFKFDFSDNYIVEQYTGLKDKNGKEIYEGDILEFTTVKPEYKKDARRGTVVFYKDSFCVYDGVYIALGRVNNSQWHKCVVVGNIHEPPKDFRPEHLKRMGVSISKGGEE